MRGKPHNAREQHAPVPISLAYGQLIRDVIGAACAVRDFDYSGDPAVVLKQFNDAVAAWNTRHQKELKPVPGLFPAAERGPYL